ncbi:MAG: histidine phosphatase family protein [Acidobacteria bacterium]|nr:MAG: histidine phosphatase family protein [Acidobacteriota bacterium]REJ99184.1 MAG: histidine phosphatase family protein [Acidobacteriota bacterium]REK16095.1 MAG: histidine phosphatase family protein [Acidobacteriota bacterium]REK43776.1 MAG: histidine phosphatase family protein [Acidobacteriota bacterium]
MKTLYVLRHAKSSWDHPELSDFERPLNDRGRKAAPFMGRLMAERDLVPEVIVSSPAVRAKTTARLASEAGDFGAEIRFDERIYGAGSNTLVYIVAEIDDSYSSAMIVGHNPGFEDLVAALTGESHRFPTAALAVIDLDVPNWSEVTRGTGSLRELFIPKKEMNRR